MTLYRATYNTVATVTVDIDVPDDVDEDDREDWASDHSHDLATEYVETWGIVGPVRLDMSLDGIGADTVEQVDQ